MEPQTFSHALKASWRFYVFALITTLVTVYLGYFVDRNHFSSFISGYGIFFGLYIWACFFQKTIPAKHLIALGIALRIVLLFSLPNLSDDYLRFLWDGRLTIAGYHPFLHTPDYFIEHQILPAGITPDLYSSLNSPHYFSVYPPVCQAVFALAAWISPQNNWIAVVVIKLFLLACEIGTVFLFRSAEYGVRNFRVRSAECGVRSNSSTQLSPGDSGSGMRNFRVRSAECGMWNDPSNHASLNDSSECATPHSAFRIPHSAATPHSALRTFTRRSFSEGGPHSALLYALNPLMILEVVGNCHFEGAMVFFLLAGIVAIQRGALAKSAAFWALATASKMLPLLFLPIVWRWLGWRKGLIFNVLFGVFTLILFAPLLAVLPNIAQSIGLYFQKFQFNASIYYLIREIGYAKTGWDIGETSGPWLALATLVGVLIITLATKSQTKYPVSRLAAAMLFALFIYLSFSAVVQPWYVCVPFAISLLSRWRFALVWSGLVALSYSHYDAGLRQEHFGLIALEYAVLWGVLIAEFLSAEVPSAELPSAECGMRNAE